MRSKRPQLPVDKDIEKHSLARALGASVSSMENAVQTSGRQQNWLSFLTRHQDRHQDESKQQKPIVQMDLHGDGKEKHHASKKFVKSHRCRQLLSMVSSKSPQILLTIILLLLLCVGMLPSKHHRLSMKRNELNQLKSRLQSIQDQAESLEFDAQKGGVEANEMQHSNTPCMSPRDPEISLIEDEMTALSEQKESLLKSVDQVEDRIRLLQKEEQDEIDKLESEVDVILRERTLLKKRVDILESVDHQEAESTKKPRKRKIAALMSMFRGSNRPTRGGAS